MLIEWLPVALALAATGMVAGVLAGLLGVGGGIVIVPVLYFIFQWLGYGVDVAMPVAVGTSLATIIPTSISSIRAHYQKGNVVLQLVQLWAPTMLIGTLLGSYLATQIGEKYAAPVFGVVALLVALNMLFRAKAAPLLADLPSVIAQRVMAFFVGLVSVMMGIGGGTIGVPLLTACGLPAHRAVGSAAVFGLVIALPGALLMLLLASTPENAPMGTFGYINLLGFALIVPLTVVMAPVGVKLGAKMNSVLLKRLFAIFLCLSAARMLYQSL